MLSAMGLFDRLRLRSLERRYAMIRSLAIASVVLTFFIFGLAHARLINNGNNLGLLSQRSSWLVAHG